MDSLIHTKQPQHNYKSPRIPKQATTDANSKHNENIIRKSLVFPLESESPAKKAPQSLIKTSSDFSTGQAGAFGLHSKAMTPKVLNSLTNNIGVQDSSRNPNKGVQGDRTKENSSLPHLYDEDRLKRAGSFEVQKGSLENVDYMDEIRMSKGMENYHSNEAESLKNSLVQSSKLPTIHQKKVMTRSDVKKKYGRRSGLDRQGNSIGLRQSDFDSSSHPLNMSNRVQVNSSPTKHLAGPARYQVRYENDEREEDVNMSMGKLCFDEKVKVLSGSKGPESVPTSIIRKRYASGCARTLQSNLSGGEDDETTPKENLSFSLVIAPVKGAQRTMKQLKKKTEFLKERISPHEGKDKSFDFVELKKLESEKVKLKIKKPKEEERAPAGLSSRKKEKIVIEEKREKREKKHQEGNMESSDKDDSGDSRNRDAEGDKDAEEKKLEGENREEERGNAGEFAKKVMERDQEEKAKDHEVKHKEDKIKIKEKLAHGTLKKIGVTSPVGKEIPVETKDGTTKNILVAAVVARANKRLQSHLHASKMMEKEKDLQILKREHAYKEFMLRMNFSFNVQVRVPREKTFTAYKYYLGKGNNSIMLKSMMKQRWWWVQIENKDAADINFMWTQLKQNKFIDNLKQKRKTPFEGLENSVVSSHSSNNETMANSLTSIDSAGTDNESDTGEGEVHSATKVTKRTKSRKTTKKAKKREEEESKAHEDMHTAHLKKLFTNKEIMLMNTIADSKGHMPLNPEDYEEIGKLKEIPAPQLIANPSAMRMCNHLENNFHLANKKALLWNMRSYYEAIKENVFDYLPLTFHVRNGFEDKEYQKFLEYYNNREKEIQEQEKEGKKNVKKLRNIWIVKPGENTNRGIGIHVCNELSQINELVATTEGNTNGRKRTYLIQQYLDRPLLYNKRKFDIRCYILITCINGTMKGYWYQEGYIRTATKEFSLKNVTNKLVHLTNDAVQKKAEDYGKFEAGNKLSYADFQKYLDQHYDGTINFNNDIYPKIRQLAIDSIKSVYGKIDPYRRENSFEVFGLDFMVDTDLRAWLIEVNTNPDINASSPALTRVIPNMVDNALKLTIDQMYPPPTWQASKKQTLPENLLENNKFELVFDEVEDGPALRNILQPDKGATGDLILEIVAEEEEEEDAEEECKD